MAQAIVDYGLVDVQQLEQLRFPINDKPVGVSPIGLEAVPADFEREDWRTLIGTLGIMKEGVQFALGDALNELQLRDEEYFNQVANETNYEEPTLRNLMWVSKAVARERRIAGLSWHHHKAVAKFEPDEQTYWLRQAVDNHWSYRQLTEEIKLVTGAIEVKEEGEVIEVDLTYHAQRLKNWFRVVEEDAEAKKQLEPFRMAFPDLFVILYDIMEGA